VAGALINIHPSLLPSFRGLDTHRRALEAGARIHGCTLHFVTVKVDDGPIIAQAAVPVLAGDSEQALARACSRPSTSFTPRRSGWSPKGGAHREWGARCSTLPARRNESRRRLIAPDLRPLAENLETWRAFTP